MLVRSVASGKGAMLASCLPKSTPSWVEEGKRGRSPSTSNTSPQHTSTLQYHLTIPPRHTEQITTKQVRREFFLFAPMRLDDVPSESSPNRPSSNYQNPVEREEAASYIESRKEHIMLPKKSRNKFECSLISQLPSSKTKQNGEHSTGKKR